MWKNLVQNRPLRWILTIGFSALFLYIAFRTLDWQEFSGALRNFNLWWLIPVVALFFLSVWLRAMLWQRILKPIGHASLWTIFRASVLSIFANILLPLNIGTILRAYLVNREVKTSLVRLLATEALERVYSMVGFLIVSTIAVIIVELPPDLAIFRRQIFGALGAALVALIAIVLLLWGMRRSQARLGGWSQRLVDPVTTRYSDQIGAGIENFVSGLRLTRNPRDIAFIIFYSVIIRIVLAYHAITIGYGFGVNIKLVTLLFVEVLVTFAAVVGDQLLGLFGSYQTAMAYSLAFFGVPREFGLSLALIATATVFVPCLVVGFIFFWMEGLTWQELKGLGKADKSASL